MQNSRMRPWRWEDWILATIRTRNYDTLNTGKVTPKNWIIVGPKNKNSKHYLVGYLDYNIGQDKGNPRIYFGRTLANLIELVYTPPRAQILLVADLI